ncbi:MAG: HpcH/HpaI aldolase/citrate lyase family protein [Clostridium sp.]|nr:HpcH/HpaI aldolase/citrate lyase family protein [Clostridium sp.]
MKNAMLYYSVGALLYCPANNEGVADSIISEKFTKPYSLALCLEDTIRDDCVLEAEEKLVLTLKTLSDARQKKAFYLPKIFIRVRNAEQMIRLTSRLNLFMDVVTGYIVPKFSLENADSYISSITCINETSAKPVYMMPIYESSSIIDLRTRYDILYTLKEKLDRIEELILNIRVGGNDLCHIFGFRRHSDESIHQIRPIANIFSDIITVYGMDYVISGPVWEYFNGTNWEHGLIKELTDDKLCGFTGKTVIHPNQIALVNATYQVLQKDLDDAKAILSWDETSHSLVSNSAGKERMNEYKTHFNWAYQTIMLAKIFGTK